MTYSEYTPKSSEYSPHHDSTSDQKREALSKPNEATRSQPEVYTWRMDAALDAKVTAILNSIRIYDLLRRRGARIVDVGSGTGRVAEEIARRLREIGMSPEVYGLDVTQEFYDSSSEQPLIKLAFGSATDQQFPDNSVSLFYWSTSAHEVVSFEGWDAFLQSLDLMYRQLEPGGELIIRDFVIPSQTGEVYLELPAQDGVSLGSEFTEPGTELPGGVSYDALSTFDLFLRFAAEFRGGNQFAFSIEDHQGKKLIKLPWEWAYEFYMRKEYRGNWLSELEEKYGFWTKEQALKCMKKAGFSQIQIEDNTSQFMMDNWLKNKIRLFTKNDSGQLVEEAIPWTHMLVSGIKLEDPMAVAATAFQNSELGLLTQALSTFETASFEQIDILLQSSKEPTVPDLFEVSDSIQVDEVAGKITFLPYHPTISEKTILIDPSTRQVGRKFTVYRLAGNSTQVIKIPNPPSVADRTANRQPTNFITLSQIVTRQNVLSELEIPHAQVTEFDQAGPPYRFIIQEALPDRAMSAGQLLRAGELSEVLVAQLCQQVNRTEKTRRYQLDTNPFAWQIVPGGATTSTLIYRSAKVYAYHDDWEFRKIGLWQWTHPEQFLVGSAREVGLPSRSQQKEFARDWYEQPDKYLLWRKYLDQSLWPEKE